MPGRVATVVGIEHDVCRRGSDGITDSVVPTRFSSTLPSVSGDRDGRLAALQPYNDILQILAHAANGRRAQAMQKKIGPVGVSDWEERPWQPGRGSRRKLPERVKSGALGAR